MFGSVHKTKGTALKFERDHREEGGAGNYSAATHGLSFASIYDLF
jgi:hypothetical protein